MADALIGVVGIVVGIALTEFVRRQVRVEAYAAPVFEKRLALYERLHDHLRRCDQIAHDVLDNVALSQEERHKLVSAAILDVAGYCDKHEMYISEELTVHCTALLMGVEEIPDVQDEREKAARVQAFREDMLAAKRMVRKEAGLADLDRLFRTVTKPRHSSAVINYYRNLLKEQGRKGRWEEP